MKEKKTATSKAQTPVVKIDFAFGKENYVLMIAGIAMIILGNILLSGGSSNDPNVFNPEVFSFRRITLAPVIILFGFGLEIYAILKKPKE